MSDALTKKPARRRSAKAGASPIPCGPGSTCGHDSCSGPSCRVRYVGPVSSLGDHHAYTASRGSTHIWAAALITSLALVVTGTVAFQSAEASQNKQAQILSKQSASRADIAELKEMMRRIDGKLDKVLGANAPSNEQLMKKIMPVEGSAIPTNTLPNN
ncbi:hypothetical protein K8R04_03385 [Candidatus Uhrbacteria bacterium]|nr:hypothetical protein [Candidatus Uhrbacteria bacterium]